MRSALLKRGISCYGNLSHRAIVPSICYSSRIRLCHKKSEFAHFFSTHNSVQEQKFPTLADADSAPIDFKDVSNEVLFTLAKQEVHEARKERLIREIMRVDRTSWQDASQVVKEMDKANDQNSYLIMLPYQIGIAFGLGAAFTAVPMVFHLDTVLWMNENFVGEDVPDLAELDTFWKVGSWAWNWMEPFHGTMSFVLLGFAFARAQMAKIHITPFTERMIEKRCQRLVKIYPQYNKGIVWDFAETDTW